MSKLRIDAKFGALILAGLFLVVIAQIIPFIGGVMEGATPELAADSEWNKSYNTDLPDVSDTWSTLLSVLGGGLALAAIFWAISPIIGKNLGV